LSLWEACEGARHIVTLQSLLYRLVESQEQVATLGYVDTLDEQALLEDMLERVKPAYPDDGAELHYLLKTPFRYPPLKWGSRFGRVHEPSLFYGGASVETTLAESAYYRLVFWASMDGAPVKDRIRTEHTLFSVGYATERGVRLQAPPFDTHLPELSDRTDYLSSQQLGTAMREDGVEAFEYRSARDPAQGTCVGLFTPAAFAQGRPRDKSQWLCETGAREVSFKQVGSRDVHRFALETFLVNGVLPFPA
jgi:hypothetical protein